VSASRPSVNTVFMLDAKHVHVVDAQKFRSPLVGGQVLLFDFKTHLGGVVVASLDVVDGQGDARCVTVFGRDGFAQVGGERSDAALARQVVADEPNAIDG